VVQVVFSDATFTGSAPGKVRISASAVFDLIINVNSQSPPIRTAIIRIPALYNMYDEMSKEKSTVDVDESSVLL
jgi:hypothetical protein